MGELQWSPGRVAGESGGPPGSPPISSPGFNVAPAVWPGKGVAPHASRFGPPRFNGAPAVWPGKVWLCESCGCATSYLQWSPGRVAGERDVEVASDTWANILQWSPGRVAGERARRCDSRAQAERRAFNGAPAVWPGKGRCGSTVRHTPPRSFNGAPAVWPGKARGLRVGRCAVGEPSMEPRPCGRGKGSFQRPPGQRPVGESFERQPRESYLPLICQRTRLESAATP